MILDTIHLMTRVQNMFIHSLKRTTTNYFIAINDPVLQRKLLEDQAKQLGGGDDEANPMDEDFVEAIEMGMPPTSGVGIGIDRMMMMVLTGSDSIKEVILFPFMKN